jgi:hypothetical protein
VFELRVHRKYEFTDKRGIKMTKKGQIYDFIKWWQFPHVDMEVILGVRRKLSIKLKKRK